MLPGAARGRRRPALWRGRNAMISLCTLWPTLGAARRIYGLLYDLDDLGLIMPRLPIDLPRMQNQARTRAPVTRSLDLAPLELDTIPPKPRKPRQMRQYELIERVKQYNPNTNEELLNRAYVYAMRAHGEQKRAS